MKVFVGLSGGVDSALSAALLQEQGHDVVGCFIKIWRPEFLECTWKEDRLDAMRVCAALGIPFCEVDLSDAYRRDVIDTMLADYQRGITPNPDVLCNEKIKFGSFARWAFAQGAERIATGHYARTREGKNGTELLRARDAAKDQSYFLYRVDEDELSRTLFPIGDLLKSDVRAEARKRGLPVAEKPDSQGLCFVGEVSMRDFLSRFINVQTGSIVDKDGTTIGEHDGAVLYTIGERHGFTTKHSGPYFVTGIDIVHNTLYVSRERGDCARIKATLEATHWISGEPHFPLKTLVQARYHEKPVSATLTRADAGIIVEFDEPHIVSPGQSLVAYEGEACLGGGVIS